MDFRGHRPQRGSWCSAPARTADGLSIGPPFAPSQITCSKLGSSANALKRTLHRLALEQRMKRVYTLFHLPSSSGRSRQGEPIRRIQRLHRQTVDCPRRGGHCRLLLPEQASRCAPIARPSAPAELRSPSLSCNLELQLRVRGNFLISTGPGVPAAAHPSPSPHRRLAVSVRSRRGWYRRRGRGLVGRRAAASRQPSQALCNRRWQLGEVGRRAAIGVRRGVLARLAMRRCGLEARRFGAWLTLR